ncbi:MAG: redoxin family protein [Bacteroidales bacterium]|nr:redoxin family protein [Bacteroidales bacterium]
MNVKRNLLLLLFFAQTLVAFSLKPAVVEGNAPFAKNRQLRFYTCNDLLLQHRVLRATAPVDDKGYFKVQIPVEETSLLTIACNTTFGSFFVEPQKQYQVELSADEELLKLFEAQQFGYSIAIKMTAYDTAELNCKINRFEYYYNRFLYHYGDFFYRHIPQHTYDSLMSLFADKFSVNSLATDYYSVYVRYRLAYIDLLYDGKNTQKLYDKYLDNPYIFYNNTAYMEFFDQFFENYLYAGTKKISKKILYENINNRVNYYKLLDEMGKDPILVNEKIREMVFIKGMGELYGLSQEFNRTNILLLLYQMQKESKFAEHRIMAENMINHLMALKPKTEAPDFVLKDVYNSPVRLSDLKGKYVYLHFFTAYCEECIREMLILKSIQEEYKDTLQIVSIMLDFEPTGLYHFVTANKEFDWLFLHFDGNYDFIDAYGVYGLPLGILIDAQGKMVSSLAKSPAQGLRLQFLSIFPTPEKPKDSQRYRY